MIVIRYCIVVIIVLLLKSCLPCNAYIAHHIKYEDKLLEQDDDKRYKLQHDSIDFVMSATYVSYLFGGWGTDVYLGIKNHGSKPIQVNLNNNIHIEMKGYDLSPRSVYVYDTLFMSCRHVDIDTSKETITIRSNYSCYFRYYLTGSPKLTLRKAKKYPDTLDAIINFDKIYLDGEDIKLKPFKISQRI